MCTVRNRHIYFQCISPDGWTVTIGFLSVPRNGKAAKGLWGGAVYAPNGELHMPEGSSLPELEKIVVNFHPNYTVTRDGMPVA